MIDLPPPTPVVEIVVSSEGMSDGVRSTDAIQVQTDFRLDADSVYAGVLYKNDARLDKNPEDGEAHAYIGVRQKLAGFGIEGRATYKVLTGKGIFDRDAMEFEGTVSRDLGLIEASAGLEYSPNDFGRAGDTYYAEGVLSTDLTGSASLSGGVGRGWGEKTPTYTAYNAGVTYTVKDAISFDVRYYGTSDVKHVAGPALRDYDDRVVASVSFGF